MISFLLNAYSSIKPRRVLLTLSFLAFNSGQLRDHRCTIGDRMADSLASLVLLENIHDARVTR